MQSAVAMPAQPPYRLSTLIAELAPQVHVWGRGEGVGWRRKGGHTAGGATAIVLLKTGLVPKGEGGDVVCAAKSPNSHTAYSRLLRS